MHGVDILTSVIIHAGTSSSQSTPPAGPASVSVATSASGNYNNAVEVLFTNAAHAPQSPNNFSGGILGGAQSTFGTASNPTRTTQTISAPASTYLSSWQANGQGNSQVMIGGYIRSNNFTTANKEVWIVGANTILSQSFATGVSVSVTSANNSREQIRDNTFANSTYGIYGGNHGGSASYHGIRIQHAAGRGANTLPQAGDSFTFRLEVQDQDQSNLYTAIHDVTINFT